MAIQKLNTMGEPQQKPNNNPMQVVNVTYGHYGSGKLYSYLGQNKRAGDIVTPEVTNAKSGKKYNTLAVVRSTHQLNNGQDTVDFLKNKGIQMKELGKTDQKSLPNYYQGWDKDAKAIDDLKREVLLQDIPQMQKLNLLGQLKSMRHKDLINKGGKN